MQYLSSSRQPLALILCLLLAGASVAAEPASVRWDELRDVENQSVSLAGAKWKVVCFLGAECPLARLYGSRLEASRIRWTRRNGNGELSRKSPSS